MYHRTERLHVTRRMIVLSLSVLVCIAAVGVWSGRGPQPHELLREVYSPTFEHVPPFGTIGDALVQLRQDVSSRTSQTAWPLSGQTIVLLIAVIVTVGIAFDFSRPRSPRNVDIILIVALSVALFDIMRFARNL